jgi:hypothetical protein
MVGEGGLEAAGEKTPTPESFRLFSSDIKYAWGWEGGGRVSVLLLYSDGRSVSASDGEEEAGVLASSTWTKGTLLWMVSLSLVDALTSSITPKVRAMP